MTRPLGARQARALEHLRQSASKAWPHAMIPRWVIINESTTREIMRSLERRGLVTFDGLDWHLTPAAVAHG